MTTVPPRIISEGQRHWRHGKVLATLSVLVFLIVHAGATERWGTDFSDGAGLVESGWDNFVGARDGMPKVSYQGRSTIGKPPEQGIEFSLDVSGTDDWFGGLYLSLPAMTDDVGPENLRIRARVAQRHSGMLMIRLESSPGNWIGLRVETPADAQWLDVDELLSAGERRGNFDPASSDNRLVLAFVNDGTQVSHDTNEDPALILNCLWLELENAEN